MPNQTRTASFSAVLATHIASFPTVLAAALSLAAGVSAFPQPPAPAKSPVPAVTYSEVPARTKGDSLEVRVRIVVPKGWHIQSDAPLDEFLIPTTVTATGDGLRFGKPVFPKAKVKPFEALGGDVAVFEDTVLVRMPAWRKAAAADAKATARAVEKAAVSVRYQACDDTQCLPPKTITARYVGR